LFDQAAWQNARLFCISLAFSIIVERKIINVNHCQRQVRIQKKRGGLMTPTFDLLILSYHSYPYHVPEYWQHPFL
jgi:hypothetical protein